MDIVFTYTNEIFEDDFHRKFWRAELKIEMGQMKRWYRGESEALAESERLCFENFLNKEWFIQTGFFFVDRPIDRSNLRIRTDGLPKKYQDLIWQLIDTLMGKDLVAKITS